MEIIDFKNNSIHYSKAQLLFYALLTGTEFNILPEKITHFVLKFWQKTNLANGLN